MKIENTYWFNNGRFQKEYEELENSPVWTKAEENAKHKYYRYYNDGDIPMGATYASAIEIERYLDCQASIAIAKAYCRTHKNEDISRTIKAYAKLPLEGFKSWSSR